MNVSLNGGYPNGRTRRRPRTRRFSADQRYIRWKFRHYYRDPINLHILTGICAGAHKPNGQTIADKMLFMVAAMAAEMERELIHERTLDGLAAAQTQGRKGGRPPAVDPDTLAIALARRTRGESVTAIAKHLGIGRSTLYRAFQAHDLRANAAREHAPAEDLADPATPPRPVRARITGPGSQIPPDLTRRLQNQHPTEPA